MPLAGIALTPLLVSPLAPSPRRSRVATSAARRPRALQRARCSATAASGEAGELSHATLLWRAAKLPIYSVALIPLTNWIPRSCFGIGIAMTIHISRLCMVAGADRDKKESVVSITGSRAMTQNAANFSLFLGFAGLLWAFAEAKDIRFILLVISAIFCGYVYQCPPFRLSYQGLGEPLCFAAFGPLATTAFYFSNSSLNTSSGGAALLPLTKTVIASSVLVGLTTTLILFCSHFHQIDGDLAVGKMSPLVRIGTKAGSRIVSIGIVMLYILLATFGTCGSLPPSCIVLCALTLPMGKTVVDYVLKHHEDNAKIFMAKYYCVRLHALFGMALASGLVLARNGILA
ncbi:2-carboxy-1,4-naphthoquinone phytyltransferase, chloroplastic isoform X1 [Zea mays]|uniref:2-carboxy-1,4-naphthoquinone phytyltransferase, chloroplastic isoform X1 n=1 Tax=Zea mays TaxID=4577 RepID=UPI0004DECBC8|nr:uncharacterized protein LOC100285808 isoform X1 [Zea mays]|eukprot:XP_008680598.1 uncharacterized protein LOC100285808 isoform X2 [Zea mays]